MPVRATFLVFALSILASGPAATPASAATASASFGVSATVQASCLASVTASAVKTYTAPAQSVPAVSVSCSNPALYAVSLIATTAPNASFRRQSISNLAVPAGSLNPSLPAIVPSGEAVGADAASRLGSGSEWLHTIHNQIPSAHCATPGADADTIIVVVTY